MSAPHDHVLPDGTEMHPSIYVRKNPPSAGWRPGWYVYRGERCIAGPCDSKSEAESLIPKILMGKPNE